MYEMEQIVNNCDVVIGDDRYSNNKQIPRVPNGTRCNLIKYMFINWQNHCNVVMTAGIKRRTLPRYYVSTY